MIKLFQKSQKKPHEERSTSAGGFIFEIGKTIVIAIALVLVIRFFLIQPFYVKGASMEPNFHDHEYLVIDEISYRLHQPERGDVIVIRYPRDPSQFFIKRLIGLPGETIEIHRDEVVITTAGSQTIVLSEPYLAPDTPTTGEIRLTLASDEYFVLGDNRTASLDSRSFGAVKKSYVVGRTWIRVWPFDRFRIFKNINYPTSAP